MTIEKHIIKKQDVKNNPSNTFINISDIIKHHISEFRIRTGLDPEMDIRSRGNGIFNIRITAIMGNKVVRESYLYKRNNLLKERSVKYDRI